MAPSSVATSIWDIKLKKCLKTQFKMKTISNGMKIYLAIFLSLLISPLAAFAALESISFGSTSYVQLTVGGVTRTFEVSGSGIESITVHENEGYFTLDLATGGMTGATIVSTNKLGFAVTPSTVTRILTCGTSDNYSTLVLQHGSSEAAVTATITPSSTTCTGSSGTGGGGGSSGGGGGGGGGGGYAYTAPTPAPVVTPVAPTVAQPSLVAQVVSPVFNKDLVRGQSNNDVRRLQELLAGDKALYPEGLVTGLFGPATERAVKRFQTKYSLPPVGRVGPMTRSKLAEVFVEGAPVAPPVAPSAPEVAAPSPATAVSPVFTSSLSRGVSNPDAKRLQQLLNSDPDTRIADSGVGSPGNETEYFGSLTEKAVQKFQKKYGVAAEGDPGYGFVGPKTRAKLQELFGK